MLHTINNRWLPIEAQGNVWSDLEDPSALSEGDWVFDPAGHAYYAGRVTEISVMDYVHIRWYKSIASGSINNVTRNDNVFDSIEIYSKLRKMWWVDPFATDEDDD